MPNPLTMDSPAAYPAAAGAKAERALVGIILAAATAAVLAIAAYVALFDAVL